MEGNNSIATLLGGVELHVKHIDGREEEVRVKTLSVRELLRYAAVCEDELSTAAVFTGRDTRWVESLTRESFELIIAEGERLNLDFLARHAARQMARRERLMPGVIDRTVRAIMENASGGLASPTTVPASLPKPA